MSITPAQRRWVLGVFLCATVAATVWVSQEEDAEVAGAADSRAESSLRLPSRREATTENTPLQLDKLTRRAAIDPTENAFANRSWVPPEPPPAPEVAPPPPTAPPLPFTYMGKLQEGSGPIIVYLVQGEQAYSVKKGDVIDKTYRVESISASQIVLTYLPMATKQTLIFGNS